MTRGNQREKAREKNLKDAKGQVGLANLIKSCPKIAMGRRKKKQTSQSTLSFLHVSPYSAHRLASDEQGGRLFSRLANHKHHVLSHRTPTRSYIRKTHNLIF
jgi:hypothetical protein